MAAFVTDLMVIYACPWTANKTKVSKCAVERGKQQTEKNKGRTSENILPSRQIKAIPGSWRQKGCYFHWISIPTRNSIQRQWSLFEDNIFSILCGFMNSVVFFLTSTFINYHLWRRRGSCECAESNSEEMKNNIYFWFVLKYITYRQYIKRIWNPDG